MEVILNINDLEYGNLFKKTSLSFEKKRIITIAGSNNCGKTTLIKILDRKIQNNFNINLNGKDIKEYNLEDYSNLFQAVYPKEIKFYSTTPREELEKREYPKEKEDFYIRELTYFNILDKQISKLTDKEFIILQIIMAMSKSQGLVALDNIDYYFDKQELEDIYLLIIRCVQKFLITVLITTTNLEEALKTDELYIIQDGEIILHGEPLTVLQKDNIINKAGLNVPFLIDLSVKLRDYDLIKDVVLDKERLINTLWEQ